MSARLPKCRLLELDSDHLGGLGRDATRGAARVSCANGRNANSFDRLQVKLETFLFVQVVTNSISIDGVLSVGSFISARLTSKPAFEVPFHVSLLDVYHTLER